MLISELYGKHWSPLLLGKKCQDPSLGRKFPVASWDTRVGIEIEAENYQGFPVDANTLDVISAIWHHKAEPSLRNSGIEFITGAIAGNQIGEALSILATMNSVGNLVYTELAGLHIHLNVRNFTVEQFSNLVMLYLVFEKSLYRVSGNREDSIYCVPARACVSGLHYLINALDIYNSVRMANKYMGFNYAVVKTYGSIEFRHSRGCRDVLYILHWINTLLRMHTAAQAWNTQELRQVLFQLNTNSEYVNFTKDIFKIDSDWIITQNLDSEMSEGVSILKEWTINSHMNQTKILDEPTVKRKPPKPIPKAVKPDVMIIDDVVHLGAINNNPINWNVVADDPQLIFEVPPQLIRR